MGVATLGFDGGPSIRLRIDPSDIQWNFQIETASIETVGGRVVQVLGATLSDLRVLGGFGENHSAKGDAGASWRLADAFAKKIKEIQSRNSTKTARALQAPAIFSYPPKGWKFAVTILALDDPQGGSVNFSTGKFAHEYMLTLFIQKDLSTTTSGLGGSSSTVKVRETAAVQSYLNRISRGFGWKKTEYNGPISIDSPTARGDQPEVRTESQEFQGRVPR
jgi:hypothetical protein